MPDLRIKQMQLHTLQTLIADRLEHLADRAEALLLEGNYDDAELLREEGLNLASAYDDEDLFLFVGINTPTE